MLMVKVTFFALLRSKHGIKEMRVRPGPIKEIINQILAAYPHIPRQELEQAVMFVNGKKTMHLTRDDDIVEDGDMVVLTHFVGGG